MKKYRITLFVLSLTFLCYIVIFHTYVMKKNGKPRVVNLDLKYILLWTRNDFSPFNNFGNGQIQFIRNNCSITTCYVTDDRTFLNGDVTKFSAIVFNGRNTHSLYKDDLPQRRSSHQIYIYMNLESAANYPECRSIFNDFYNWTSTYKLTSDIPVPYILVRNKKGDLVGPKVNMTWVNSGHEVDVDFKNSLKKKTKVAAWFVSNCHTSSRREQFVRRLQAALAKYNITVDVYGDCGPFKCKKSRKCDTILKDYHFYLSFENSISEDYVTEKVLRPLSNDVVPIVLGGANYSRFLPPGSYLKADNPKELAKDILEYMYSREYYNFFKWKTEYMITERTVADAICAMCSALNNKTMIETQKVYKNFTKWWGCNCSGKTAMSNWTLQLFILLLFLFSLLL